MNDSNSTSLQIMRSNELSLDILQLASHHYLTSPLPDNWFDLTDSAQSDFILDHVWQPFEYKSAQSVWDCIENAALKTHHFIQDRYPSLST